MSKMSKAVGTALHNANLSYQLGHPKDFSRYLKLAEYISTNNGFDKERAKISRLKKYAN
ncbi:MAG: hypothetical protein KAS32_20385 [Candidatus Peribacteraceae bacterium]|nr:hypothetical protein [Candidatus Peribacteraceae bacterium]